MNQNTKIALEKVAEWMRRPDNAKSIIKVFSLGFIATFGAMVSIQSLCFGLLLLKEAGIPETTIKLAVGMILSMGGFLGIVMFTGKFGIALFEIVYGAHKAKRRSSESVAIVESV